MATSTTKLLLRKPDGDPTTGDNINVDTDLNDNFDKLDDAVGVKVCTNATRPTGADRWDGRVIRETDTGKCFLWAENLATWLPLLAGSTFDGSILMPDHTDQVNIGGSASGANFAAMNDGTRALFSGRINGNVNNRYQIDPDGKVNWGDGTAALDTNLYRSAASTLKTDDSLVVLGSLTLSGNFSWGSAISVEAQQLTDGVCAATTYTATLTGSTTPGLTFIAAQTGRAWINWFSQQLNDAAVSTYSSFELRTGGSIGAGTIIIAASDDNAIVTDPSDANQNIVSAGLRKLATGLTPGASYNCRGMFKVASGNGSYRTMRISAEPAF